MRFRRLDLTRYGRFTGHSIDFGACQPGVPDLHIVYGPNEAGKSTSLAAILDLFFGIEPRSQYGFLHAYPTMRIGAAVEIEGKVLELARIKKNQGSLLDAAGHALPDAVILSQLGGIDRAAYRSMFSLDDETLEAGGEAILESQGELGALLFSASAGLPDLSQMLSGLRKDMGDFHRQGARSGILYDLKAKLAQLREERARLDMAAPEYARLVETRDRGKASFDAASEERRAIRQRLDEARRHLTCLPRLADLRNIRHALAPLRELPDAPLRWNEEVVALIRQEIELSTRLATAIDDIVRAEESLASIAIDERALALVPRIETLADIRARYVTAEKDLPERRLALRQAEMGVAGILARIGQVDAPPERLLLPAAITARLRSLIEAWSGLAKAQKNAEDEHDRMVEELRVTEDRLAVAGGAGRDDVGITILGAAMAVARAGDSEGQQRLHRRTMQSRQAALESALAALRPWAGDVAALVSIAMPTGLDAWRQALVVTGQEMEGREAEIQRVTTVLERQMAERDALMATTGLSDDTAAGTTRAARETAWGLHRQSLDITSAQAFEAALRRDDLVTAARVGQASDLARLGQLQQAIAVTEVERRQAETALVAARERNAEIMAGIGRAVTAIGGGLPTDITGDALAVWLTRRETALAAAAMVRETENDLVEAEAEERQIRSRLAAALEAAGLQIPALAELDVLRAIGQAALDGEAERKLLHQHLAANRRQLHQRKETLDRAVAEIDAWRESWRTACVATCFGGGAELPGIAEMREILGELAALEPLVLQQAGLSERIAKMVADQNDFADKIGEIAEHMGLEDAQGDPLDLFHAASGRADGARDALSRQRDRHKALNDARSRRRELDDTARSNADQASIMLVHFGVDSLAAAEMALAQLARRAELTHRERQAADEIAVAFPDRPLEEAEAALDAIDRAALDAELGEMETRFEEADQRARQLYADYTRAEDQVQAVGGDDAAARLEEQRRTVLAEIEEGATAHLRLAAGALAAENALRLYRDRHRSAMMTRASEAFRIISNNGYRGLATQPGKEGDVLIGSCSDGTSKVAASMSKGTRFQLYLALRVAGYHEYVAHRPSLPFIADDIMETFDDLRAEETLRVFANLGRAGQVIYLTHHQHLCGLARAVCPQVKIHELPPPYAAS